MSDIFFELLFTTSLLAIGCSSQGNGGGADTIRADTKDESGILYSTSFSFSFSAPFLVPPLSNLRLPLGFSVLSSLPLGVSTFLFGLVVLLFSCSLSASKK